MTLLRNDGTWAPADGFRFAATKTDRYGSFTAGVQQHFMPAGECWQRHGIHGVLDRSVGLEGLREVAEANPDHEFGLFELVLSQKSACVATLRLPQCAPAEATT